MENNKYNETLNRYNIDLNEIDMEQKVNSLLKEKLAENANTEVYKQILSCIDFTSLNATDTPKSIGQLVEIVNILDSKYGELPHVAAVCVYPNFTQVAQMDLEVSDVNIAVVSGAFPHAQSFTEIKIAEIALALNDGANEVDIPLPLGDFFEGNYQEMCDEIAEMKAACQDAKLKVILETATLETATNIKKAAILAMYAGADFIKTSTGKASTGASPLAALVMCEAIKEYHQQTGIKIGFKAAGGINTTANAVAYYTIVKEILGHEWLNKELFRIGASRLMDTLLSDITGESVSLSQ